MDYHDEISVMEHQVTDRKALIETLNAAFLESKLENALRRYWSLHLLEVIRPGENPQEWKHNKGHLWRLLLEPVEAFIAGKDQPAEKFATLKKEDPPTFICNRSIPAGETWYSCRDCAVDSTCVLCIECFKQSAHKNHRFKEIEKSSDFGYCDCGKSELWRKDFACDEHEPLVDLKDVNFNREDARIRVPEDISKRFTEAIRHALCYVYQVLTFRDGVPIPPDLACPSPSKDHFPFVTILYINIVHSYDDIIETLTLALECTQEDASEYATVVDYEGRSPVKFGSEDECERVKKCVERDWKGQESLRLDVVQTAAYAHQVFALEVLTWIQSLAEKCEGFRALVCDVFLQFSPVWRDHPIVSTFLLEDVRLWKAARRGCYSLFMATFLIFNDAKIEFSRLFALLYTQLTTAFISDDLDYFNSCSYSSTVQLFPVPTVARTLFSDGLVEVILNSFVLFCQSRRNAQGRLSFDRAMQPAIAAEFERALYTLNDAKCLFNTVPTSDQWADALRKGFIGTFEQFLQIMVMMEGMDGYTWNTQSHVEYETDWKPAFDMQFHMGGTITLLQQWCASDNKVLSVCIEKLLTAALMSLHAVVTPHAVTSKKIKKIKKKEVGGCSFDCIEYDVSTQIVSIHHPVIRMLAGLVVPALAKRIVLEVSGGRMPIEEQLKLHARELLELPLRTMVLVAQAHRGMWRRDDNALYHQISSYQQPRWRGEMLDKDIVMMQACAAVMPPDSFLIALLDKFALLPWADETFDATSIHAEDDSVRQVIWFNATPVRAEDNSILQMMCLAEDFLYGVVVLVGERFYPSVGHVTEEDCLKNEVIHLLCKENMSYSEILKYLPDQEANFSLDELIKEVGVLKELSPTGEGLFELKAELTERFNLFFYHYTMIEHSKAKDTQRKRRKKTWEEVVFAPPCPPPFSDAFSRIVHLLDCDVFIHLLTLTVQRALINHPRFFFDDQLLRMLYLVGYALHEEKRQRLSSNDNNHDNSDDTNTNNNNNFKFVEKANDAGVFMTLRELRVRGDNETYKNLLEWVLHFYDDLTKQESMDTTEAPPVDNVGDAGDDDVEKKKRRSAVRRKQIKDAKISYASQDVGDLKEIALPDDASSKGTVAPYKLVQKETIMAVGGHILVIGIGAIDIVATVFRAQLEDETETKTFTIIGPNHGYALVDRALMRYLQNQFIIQHKISPETAMELTSWHRLRMECEKARVRLSSALTTVLFVPNFAVGYDLHVELTRDTFEEAVDWIIVEDVVAATKEVLALLEKNVKSSTKNNLLMFLVGGGSRISCIRQRMDAEFNTKISSASVVYCEEAAVIGAAEYTRMLQLEPNVMKLDIVQHYRDLCDFYENLGKPWGGNAAARLAILGSACTHTSTEPAVACLHSIISIVPSHGISIKTDRVSYRFSIRGRISGWTASFMKSYRAQLHHIELTETTAASLQLQQRHMSILSFQGTLEHEDLTGTSVFDTFEGRMTMIRNPLDLCHPNVVRCLAVGRTPPMREQNCFTELSYGPVKEEHVRVLLDIRLKDDSIHDYLFLSSGLDITLHRFCKERGSALGNKEIINKTKQLLDGLSYLHGLEIPFILTSLTSSGILVTPDGETVKIWDILFGLLDKSPSQLHFNVSSYFTNDLLAYAHPDVSNYILEVSRDHEKCSTLTFRPNMDIWSLGCVVLDMVSRGHHFSCINRYGVPLNDQMRPQDFVRTMVNGGLPLIPSSAPDIIRQLCTACFERKADRRTDAIRLLAKISQIPENELDVCTIDKARPKHPSASLYKVSEDVLFEIQWVSYLAEGRYGNAVYTIDIINIDNSVHNNFPEAVACEMRNKKVLKILDCELPKPNGDLLVRLSHNHVVKYITTGTLARGPGDAAWDKKKTGILMEHCTGGDLNQHARQQDLSATEILEFARQIASGLKYLHGNRDMEDLFSIAHGDLKGQNIFLISGTPATAKIGDLDSLAILDEEEANIFDLRIEGGTYTHMSPEMAAFVLRSKDGEDTDSVSTNIGRPTDIYSFGCTILEMFGRGNVPYSNKDGSKLRPQVGLRLPKSVVAGAHPDVSVAIVKNISSDFLELLKECLQRDPKKRPIASYLLQKLTKLKS